MIAEEDDTLPCFNPIKHARVNKVWADNSCVNTILFQRSQLHEQ